MTTNKQQSVSVSRTKATHLLIKCANLVPGKHYIFQSRCKALCGFGPNMYAVGYYPGESCYSTSMYGITLFHTLFSVVHLATIRNNEYE